MARKSKGRRFSKSRPAYKKKKKSKSKSRRRKATKKGRKQRHPASHHSALQCPYYSESD